MMKQQKRHIQQEGQNLSSIRNINWKQIFVQPIVTTSINVNIHIQLQELCQKTEHMII